MKIIVCQLHHYNGIVPHGFAFLSDKIHHLIGYNVNQHSQTAILGACTSFRLVVKK